MNEALKNIVVKPTNENEARLIVAVFNAEGFKNETPWTDRQIKVSIGIFLGHFGRFNEPLYGESLGEGNKEIPLSKLLWGLPLTCRPEWAHTIGRHNCTNSFAWIGNELLMFIDHGQEFELGGSSGLTEDDFEIIATRPQPAPEPVWPEPGSLPPVGEMCECTFGDKSSWNKCVLTTDGKLMVFHRDNVAPLYSPLGKYGQNLEFRKIQTERDRLIKQALKTLARASHAEKWDGSTFEVEALIDFGWRPTK